MAISAISIDICRCSNSSFSKSTAFDSSIKVLIDSIILRDISYTEQSANNNIGADSISQILTDHNRFAHSLDRL